MPSLTPSACACPSCPLRRTGSWRPSEPKEAAMRTFDYVSPTATKQVPDLLGKSWGEVEVLAGGSDLLSLMKDEVTTPKRLVNIKHVTELHGVALGKDRLTIGALTTLAEVAADKSVQLLYPTLAAAAGDAAS